MVKVWEHLGGIERVSESQKHFRAVESSGMLGIGVWEGFGAFMSVWEGFTGFKTFGTVWKSLETFGESFGEFVSKLGMLLRVGERTGSSEKMSCL